MLRLTLRSALQQAGNVSAPAWLLGGATVMGISIWSMHFTGMLAFRLPVPVSYYWPTVIEALLVAIAAAAVALYVVSQKEIGLQHALTSAIAVGAGIAALHYMDMFAMRLAAQSRYNAALVVLSVLFAIMFSFTALWLCFRFREGPKGSPWRRIGSATIMGTAISAMHYTGMAAASFVPSDAPLNTSHTVNISSLGTAGIITVTLILLGLAVLSCSVDRRFHAQALELALAGAGMDLARATRVATFGELTASITHEINQPLGAVVTYASSAMRWLDMQPPNVAEAREAVTQTVREANRASEVIARVRALFQKQPPQMERLDLNEIIREVLDLTQSDLQKARITVETELVSDLPLVLGDRIQLQQVILNLTVNAIEAMGKVSGRPRTLRIKSTIDADGVLALVQDNGVGLEPGLMERIFHPFFTTKSQGIGMGLSISRSIVEAHGGRLWVTPVAPHGAIFQFTLPLADSVT